MLRWAQIGKQQSSELSHWICTKAHMLNCVTDMFRSIGFSWDLQDRPINIKHPTVVTAAYAARLAVAKFQ